MAQRPTEAGSELPLSEASYLILIALAERPMHGYLIMQTINTVFRTGFQMGPGTLYRTLHLQLKGALIRETDDGGSNSDDPRRRYYTITRRGQEVARQELQRLRTLHRLGGTRIGTAYAE